MNATRNRFSQRSSARRGSTMILVVAMLVLLLIVATAFVGRAQSSRFLASAQQLTAAQTDRVGPIAHAVTEEIAQSLFVQPVDKTDAALVAPFVDVFAPVGSSAVPRIVASANETRYSVDPLDALNNSSLATGSDGLIDGYNFAPYEVRPWTNWPDVYNIPPATEGVNIRVSEANPVGNPSFGDCRWLRSTEPVRVEVEVLVDGVPTIVPAFSHWAHLSWIPTANNGWRLVTDISDVAKNTLVDIAPSQKPSDFFPGNPKRWGLEIPYEQWLPSRPPDPSAYEWIPTTLDVPTPTVAERTLAAQTFQALAFGLLPVANPVGGWFSSEHLRCVQNESDVLSPLPNFLRLKWFGVKADEFVTDSPRNIITRTLCDTDGDGFTDSFWFLAPTSSDRSIRHLVGVSVVDNSALLNVNVATRFDLATTGGKTPADLALVSRQTLEPGYLSGEAGFLGSQTATAPAGTYPAVTVGVGFDVGFDAKKFGSPTFLAAGTAVPPTDNRLNPTLLSEIGVMSTAAAPVARPAFPNFLSSDSDRTNYFKSMARGGDVEGYFDASGNAVVRTNSRPVDTLDPFTMADELELRAFNGQNNPYVRSRLERALESDGTENATPNYSTQFLRSTMAREETSEFYDQLDARQLLFDNRRKLTTVSGARNDMLPPWLWTMPPEVQLWQMPGPLASWPVDAIRGWKHLYQSNISYRENDYCGVRYVPEFAGPDIEVQFPEEAGAAEGDGNCDGVIDQRDVDLARSQFLAWNRKVDLNKEVDPYALTHVDYRDHQHDFARDVMKVLQRSLYDPHARTSIFGQEVDASLPDYNARAVIEAKLATASWTANIVAAADSPRRFWTPSAAGQAALGLPLDPPFHPDSGILVDNAGDLEFDGEEQDDVQLSFIGQEKHPFILQAFFAVVYPKVGKVTIGSSGIGNSFVTLTPPDGSDVPLVERARVVLAVQIANPYNEPIDLSQFALRAFGQDFSFYQPIAGSCATEGGWGYGPWIEPATSTVPAIYGPSVLLGPSTEERPCSAIVFAIPHTITAVENQTTSPDTVITDPNFRVHMMNFLDLSHPWLRAGNAAIPACVVVPHLLQNEIQSVPPAEFFPAAPTDPEDLLLGAHDLFEDRSPLVPPEIPPATLGTDYADSMVFNATRHFTGVQGAPAPTAAEVAIAGGNRWSVDPMYYRTRMETAGNVIPTAADPEKRDRALINASEIAIVRRVQNPDLPATPMLIVVDRLENEFISPQADFVDDPEEEPVRWHTAIERVLNLESLNGARTGYVPPKWVTPSPGSASQNFAHVDIGTDDFLMCWVRVSRPWVLDLDHNGAITSNERSPRFIFPYHQHPELAGIGQGAEFVPLAEGVEADDFHGDTFRIEDLTDPVALEQLAVRVDSANGPEFRSPFGQDVHGKPTNFTLKTTLAGAGRVYPSFDDRPSQSGWPGLPGSPLNPPHVIYGDTGAQLPDPTLEFYQVPYQLEQRDGPFEQVAEIFDVPVWGPVMFRDDYGPWELLATYGEMMIGKRLPPPPPSHGPGTPPPAGHADQTVEFPTFGLAVRGIQDKSEMMRFQFDRRRVSRTNILGIDPNGSDPPGSIFAPAAFLPSLPLGATILDGFTVDGAGTGRIDNDDSGQLSAGELLFAEGRRLRLAREFSGESTPGLVNINTAPIEVLRALPNMQQLSYNSDAPPYCEIEVLPGCEGSAPLGQRVRVPETIINYRDRIPPIHPSYVFPSGPKYDDRGFVPAPLPFVALFPFHPGMRAERGFASVGELALLDREYRPANTLGTTGELDPEDVADDSNWAENKSWAIAFAGRDPYRTAEAAALTTQVPPIFQGADPPAIGPSDLGAGWRAPIDPLLPGEPQTHSAQLPTERLSQKVIQFDSNATFAIDPIFRTGIIAGDQVERNALLKGIANMVTTRSDVFTVYLRIRTVAQDAASGKWDATKSETLIDESRYVLVVDRSHVNRPGEQPKILMFEKIVE